MKADITRKTFKKEKRYRKVNMQQGRVQIDADWNEQIEIQVNHDITALRDIIGRTGVPKENGGFEIKPSKNGYTILRGRYYVDGILCENDKDIEATEQKDLPSSTENNALPSETGKYILYLDVWPRHLTALEDPSIREVALGGADTATRTQYVWQAKWFALPENFQVQGDDNVCESAFGFLNEQVPKSEGGLKARAKPAQPTTDPCEMPLDAKYRRLENQLYRVEIHDGGKTGNGATFKWSRDNGIVVAKVTDIISSFGKNKIKVSSIGRDRVSLGFNSGQWVEVTDDRRELWGLPGTIVKLVSAEDNELVFDPNTVREGDLAITNENFANQDYNPKVRRWDSDYRDETSGSTSGVIPVTIPAGNDGYIQLEDGIEIRFTEEKTYKTEDYWLIPARTAIGDIEWPNDENGPIEHSIEGIVHHYAPLALIEYDANIDTEDPESESPVNVISDCRRIFSAATDPILYYVSGDGQHGGANSELKYPMIAGIARGNVPEEGLKVTFRVIKGEGELRNREGNTSSTELSIKSDENGLVECFWKLGSSGDQQVEAIMVDHDDNNVHLPLRFNAIIEQPRAEVTTPATSGIIEIELRRGMNPFIGPFKHFLESEIPPAILLGRVYPQGVEPEGDGFETLHAVSIVPGADTMTNNAYSPNPLTVSVGDTVTWTNNDSAPHTVTSGAATQPDGKFDSGIRAPQQIFGHTFTEPGEYPYFCTLHPNMIGTVIVARSPRVRFMEDYYLYRSEIIDNTGSFIFPGFKPVNVTTSGFCIRLINVREQQEGQILRLRWWAIPAKQQERQTYTAPRIEFEPRIVTIGNNMTLRVTDPNVRDNTFDVNVMVRIMPLRGGDQPRETIVFGAELKRDIETGTPVFHASAGISHGMLFVGEASQPVPQASGYIVTARYDYRSCTVIGGNLESLVEIRMPGEGPREPDIFVDQPRLIATLPGGFDAARATSPTERGEIFTAEDEIRVYLFDANTGDSMESDIRIKVGRKTVLFKAKRVIETNVFQAVIPLTSLIEEGIEINRGTKIAANYKNPQTEREASTDFTIT